MKVSDTSEGGQDFEERLGAAAAKGCNAWPAFDLPLQEFIWYLAARVPEEPEQEAWLAALPVEDLYLSLACAQGLDAALAEFETRYIRRVPAFLRHLRPPASAAESDEVQQVVRDKLFVSVDGAPPKIAEYQGRGELAGWVRAVALRVALNLRRQEGRQVAGRADDAALQAISAGVDPEAHFIKVRSQEEFRDALREAFSMLSGLERNLLRLYLVDRLTLEQIGVLMKISHSTVWRRMAAAREAIADRTIAALQARLGLPRQELQSLARLARSQLDLSITGLLCGVDR